MSKDTIVFLGMKINAKKSHLGPFSLFFYVLRLISVHRGQCNKFLNNNNIFNVKKV